MSLKSRWLYMENERKELQETVNFKSVFIASPVNSSPA